MPISSYGAVIHQAQVEQMTAALDRIVRKPGFDAAEWCAPVTNFGQVLEKIRQGVLDEEISAAHPGWRGDVLRVCHRIVDGELSRPADKRITEEQFKKKKKEEREREKKRMGAYRRRYGRAGKDR